MDNQKKFNETLSPEEDDFHSDLNMENIAHVDYAHAKRICKGFEKKIQNNIMNCISKEIHYCQLIYSKTFEL